MDTTIILNKIRDTWDTINLNFILLSDFKHCAAAQANKLFSEQFVCCCCQSQRNYVYVRCVLGAHVCFGQWTLR